MEKYCREMIILTKYINISTYRGVNYKRNCDVISIVFALMFPFGKCKKCTCSVC